MTLKWRDGPYARQRSNVTCSGCCLTWWWVSRVAWRPGWWWMNQFLLNLCKIPEISPLVLETFMCHHFFGAFWQWFPIISCNFQADLTQNQGAFKGQTKSEKCLVKLIVWCLQGGGQWRRWVAGTRADWTTRIQSLVLDGCQCRTPRTSGNTCYQMCLPGMSKILRIYMHCVDASFLH